MPDGQIDNKKKLMNGLYNMMTFISLTFQILNIRCYYSWYKQTNKQIFIFINTRMKKHTPSTHMHIFYKICIRNVKLRKQKTNIRK